MEKRDSYLDNAKGILIVLVFFGHGLEYINGWQNKFTRYLLTGIYLLHMPAFCFLAGITTSTEKSRGRAFGLMCLFVAYQIIYTPFIYFDGWKLSGVFIMPIYTLWFLFSLTVWTFFLPLILQLKHCILILILLSLLSGGVIFIGYKFGLGRTLYFAVFFVLGKIYGADFIVRLKYLTNRVPKLTSVSAIVFLTSFTYSLNLDHTAFYGVSSYSKVGYGFFEGAGLRLVIYLISFSMIISFLAIVGSKNNVITKIGRNSLSVFLLHPLLLLTVLGPLSNKINRYFGVEVSTIIIALISFFVSLAFSNSFVRNNISKPQIYMEKKIRRVL